MFHMFPALVAATHIFFGHYSAACVTSPIRGFQKKMVYWPGKLGTCKHQKSDAPRKQETGSEVIDSINTLHPVGPH